MTTSTDILAKAREVYFQAELLYRDRLIETGRLLHAYTAALLTPVSYIPQAYPGRSLA